MTGPPTPPPSSATEIEDAARTSLPPPQAPPDEPATEPQAAPEAPPAAPPPAVEEAPQDPPPAPAVQQPIQTSYELLFPAIAALARSGSLTELVEVAERGDLNVCSVLTCPRILRRSKKHPHTGGER